MLVYQRVSRGFPQMVVPPEELLEEGVDIDLKGRYRRTAFAEAHLRGHFAVAGPS